MYKLYNKKTIEGLSPLVVEKAEKDYIQMITKGYSKQATSTTGKNKLDQTLIEKKKSGNNFTIEQQTDTSIKCYGTATNTSQWVFELKNPIILTPGIYTFSPTMINNISASPSMSCRLLKTGDISSNVNENSFGGTWTAISNNSSIPATITETTTFTHLFLHTNANYETDIVVNFQVESGNSKSAFEHFIPTMPSPNYPSRIRNIGDNINLFDKNNANILNAIINRTSKVVTAYGTCRTIYIPCLNNEDYIISKKAGTRFIIGTTTDLPSIGITCNQIVAKNTASSLTISTTDSDNYLLVFYYNSGSDTLTEEEIRNSIKIEKGKVATSYTEYGCGSIDYEIENKDKTEIKTIHFPLSERQLLHEGDYLAEDGIHQKKKTIILTGEETIILKVASQGNSCIFSVDGIWNNKDLSTRGNIICTHFKNEPIKWANIDECIFGGGQSEGNTMYFKILKSRLSEITSADCKAFVKQQYENNTPIIVEYQLAEEVITPLTTGQQNVIDNIELFEGYNQINSLDEFDFEMKIIYTPQFTEDIRKSFRTGITKAYLEVIGTDIIIDYQNYLKNIEFYELRFVPDKGIFGQAVAKKIVVNFNNLDNTLNLQDKEIRLFIETEVDEENYRIKYGDFIVQHPENENVNDNTSLTGLDYMIKTNIKYTDTITYPCTLRQLANNICTQCGLTLSKESFKNENFVVENNQFVSGETCRQIIQGIALSAFSWARIDENNELHFDFDKNFSIKEELTNDEYYNLDFNNEIYGPVNRVIMRDSQIDGENVTVSDNDSIETNGVNEIVIEDNPFAYTQEKREQLIEAGKDLFGFSYLPINSSKLIGYIYLNCLDKVKFKNMQGQSFETYFFNHIINYEGTTLDTIEVPAMTKTETKYTFIPDITQTLKNTQIIVDKANQNILGIIEKQEGQSNQITSIEASLDGINTKIQDNQDEINERFNKIETTLEGTTQILSNKGGNNIFYYAKEFWTDGTENGTAKLNEYTDTEVQKISVSGNGYKINKGTSEQKVNVKNDIYTISFTYKKLIDLATGYVLINNERIDLSSSEWKEEVITLNIDTNNVDFKIISDTDNAFEIYDLMGTIGEEKQIWTQNPNETRTDTVTIGKGIEVKSSSKNTYARFDADGNRIFNNSTNEVVTALTDKGVETNEIDSELGKIGGILIQKMDSQTWISSLL